MNLKELEQKKNVDLSCLMTSGIDCEFSNDSDFSSDFVVSRVLSGEWDSSTWIGRLSNITDTDFPYFKTDGFDFKYCRPRLNHWQAWLGGKCPLPEGFIVLVMFIDGIVDRTENAPSYDWNRRGYDIDIIAFNVLGLADGWKYPWEK